MIWYYHKPPLTQHEASYTSSWQQETKMPRGTAGTREGSQPTARCHRNGERSCPQSKRYQRPQPDGQMQASGRTSSCYPADDFPSWGNEGVVRSVLGTIWDQSKCTWPMTPVSAPCPLGLPHATGLPFLWAAPTPIVSQVRRLLGSDQSVLSPTWNEESQLVWKHSGVNGNASQSSQVTSSEGASYTTWLNCTTSKDNT